jgi:hypothetical protein
MAGNDEMANESVHRQYTDAVTAQLGERVTNLGRRQTDLEAEMRAGFKAMEAAVTGLANETRSSIAALSTNLAERNKPQWQALGGGTDIRCHAGWSGISANSRGDERSEIRGSRFWRTEWSPGRKWTGGQARSAEDRGRMETAVSDLRGAQVPRTELERVWAGFDQRFADHQRQLDDVKQAQGAVYGARDVLLDLRERIDRMERQRLNPGP